MSELIASPISPTLLVLAAGMGSRYGGLKQIEPVGPAGETILDYSIYDALRSGFRRVVFVIREEMAETFHELVGSRFEEHIKVDYVFQVLDKLPPGWSPPPDRTKPWGTTHAVLMAAGTIDEPFAVINADDFYGVEGYRVLAHHLRFAIEEYAMVGFLLRNTLSDFGPVSRGICSVTAEGYLADVVEMTRIKRTATAIASTDEAGQTKQLSGDELVSLNLWGFHPNIFADLQQQFEQFLERNGSDLRSECYLPSSINTLIQSGRAKVEVLRTHDSWFGITYRADLPHVIEGISRLVHEGYYPKRLWA